MFFVIGAAYAIKWTGGNFAARMTGIRSSASSGMTTRAIFVVGFHRTYSTGLYARY
jgi:hypothetical protein